MKILFVCTGSTCRSPMAMVIFENICKYKGRRGVTVRAAGTWAWDGQPMMEFARLALIECGEELPKKTHKSALLTVEMQRVFDHIVDVRHIPDPVGGTLDAYVNTCRTLQREMHDLYGKIFPGG